MITIPEELLTKSSKELKKILDNKNNFNAIYFLENENYIRKIEKRYKGIVILKKENKLLSTTLDQYLSSYSAKPLSYTKFQKLKLKNIEEYLSKCSNENFIKYLQNLSKDIFGEEFVDIYQDEDDKDFIDLVIYFPEITITNSVELSHTMKDVYFKLEFYKKKLDSISLARTTLTDKEFKSNYIFSHSNYDYIGKWGGYLCLGMTAFANIKNKLCNGYLFYNIQAFLLMLKDYLSWESIEGKPYKYISQINEKGDLYIKSRRIYRCIESSTAYYKIIKNITDFSYTYELLEGKYVIKLTEESINQIEELLTTNYPESCYYLVNNESCVLNSDINNTSIETIQNTNSEIIFKGNVIKNKIIITDNEVTIEPPKRIHRDTLKEVVSMLENNFKDYLINKKLMQ